MSNAILPAAPTAARETFRSRWLDRLWRFRNGDESPSSELDAADSCLDWAADAGFSQEDQLRALAESLSLEFVEDLRHLSPSETFLQSFEIAFARQHRVLGIAGEDGSLRVALCDWNGWEKLDVISRVLGKSVEPLLTTAAAVATAINAAYQERTGQAQELIDSLDQETVLSELQALEGREDLLDTSGRAPVIKLVNLTVAISRLSTSSVVFVCMTACASNNGMATMRPKAVVFMAIDMLADKRFALSAGSAPDTAEKASIRPMMVPRRPSSVAMFAKVAR